MWRVLLLVVLGARVLTGCPPDLDRVPPTDARTPDDRRGEGRPDAALGMAWAQGFGGPGHDAVYGVASDSRGNLYVIGYFGQTIAFGGTPLLGQGLDDIFLVSLTSDGTHRWSKAFGGDGLDWGRAIVIGPDGHLYVAGMYAGAVSLGGEGLPDGGDQTGFVASFTSDGTYRWSRGLGAGNYACPNGMTVAADGTVLVAGSFFSTATLGASSVDSAGDSDIFLASLTVDGEPKGLKRWGGTGRDSGNDVDADPMGNVFLTGSFRGTVDFGCPGGTGCAAHVAQGSQDVFALSVDPAGAVRWARSFGSATDGEDQGRGLVVDGQGSVYLVGEFVGPMNLGRWLAYAGGADGFVARLDSADGGVRWAQSFGGPGWEKGRALAWSSAGTLFVTGGFAGAASFGEFALTAATASDSDVLVGSLDPSEGRVTAVRTFGGEAEDSGAAIAADGAGRVYAAGSFQGSVEVDAKTLGSAGLDDVFIVGLGP